VVPVSDGESISTPPGPWSARVLANLFFLYF
jgi:hypothetical protein